jgi:GNAT superfamily N-acetyltransferase
MLFELGKNIRAEAILFLDKTETCLAVPGTTFRRRSHDDPVFKHSTEPVGDYVLTLNGEVVATGGFLQHYNHPFADLYMEVREDQRRKGLGSLILQETKKACYRSGRVPAARCNVKNQASKATLLKAGFEIGGYMLVGEVV